MTVVAATVVTNSCWSVYQQEASPATANSV